MALNAQQIAAIGTNLEEAGLLSSSRSQPELRNTRRVNNSGLERRISNQPMFHRGRGELPPVMTDELSTHESPEQILETSSHVRGRLTLIELVEFRLTRMPAGGNRTAILVMNQTAQTKHLHHCGAGRSGEHLRANRRQKTF